MSVLSLSGLKEAFSEILSKMGVTDPGEAQWANKKISTVFSASGDLKTLFMASSNEVITNHGWLLADLQPVITETSTLLDLFNHLKKIVHE
jgi:hypothetical protein